MLVTVATCNWIIEADMIVARLDAEGVKAFIPDEGMVQINPIYANAIGGIRVQVDEPDLDRAREILKEGLPLVDKGIAPCPLCGSGNVHYERISRRLAFASLLLIGIPLLWIKHRWKCEDCGHKWKLGG